ncbi:reverse transcriptase [Corchorus capsularis]|uniref:Reverse transcriptase n=1 Tax=Corchorus capsularis TaxID=210143 RepID=A0A1R3FWF2_COCAP|nr:reverse transcriptase [Corchorus capsularis]
MGKCFKCNYPSHRSSDCTYRKINFVEDYEVNGNNDGCIYGPDGEDDYDSNDDHGTYVVTKMLLAPKVEDENQTCKFFRTRCNIDGEIFSLIIDNEVPEEIYLDLKQNDYTKLHKLWMKMKMIESEFAEKYGAVVQLMKVKFIPATYGLNSVNIVYGEENSKLEAQELRKTLTQMTFVRKGGRDTRVTPEYPDWHWMRVKDIKVLPPTNLEAAVGEEMDDIVMKLTMQLERERDGTEAQRIAEVNWQLMLRIEEAEKRAEEMSAKCREVEEEAKDQIKIGLLQVEYIRDQAKDVLPCLAPFGQRLQPIVDALEDTISKCDETLQTISPGSSGTAETTETENVPSTGITVSITQVNVPILSSSQIDLPIPLEVVSHYPQWEGATCLQGKEVPVDFKAEDDLRKLIEESTEKLWGRIEEKFKGIGGQQTYFKGVDKVALVTDLVLPAKFKVPEFEKFDGTKSPEDHVNTYVRQMQPYCSDDMLMHHFQRSLAGSSFKWYNRIDPSQVKTWNDMANAFIAQYRHIDELAPTRETLHSMKRKPGETIKEYGQRFKDMALEVDPLMKDTEVGNILLKTLPKEYFRELYQAATNSFTRLTIAREAYESGLRAGVFEEAEKKGHAKKKEGDTHEEQKGTRLKTAEIDVCSPGSGQERQVAFWKHSSGHTGPKPRKCPGDYGREGRGPKEEDSQVPWKYDCSYTMQQRDGGLANITGVGGMTRSGRIYSPEDKGKSIPSEKVGEKDQSPSPGEGKEEVVGKVSDLDRVVGNIAAEGFITFSEIEILEGGRKGIKALHITVKCENMGMGRVLIDNGSTLNIMPLNTLKALPVEPTYIHTNHMVVRAFDGTRRDVIGELEICLEIGPIPIKLMFQVLDIDPSYSCLLERPWIYMAGAIPSTLHQKVKFMTADKLVIVNGQEDMIVTQTSATPYVEAVERSYECSFRAFEVDHFKKPKEGTVMAVQVMKKYSWKEGQDHQMLADARKMRRAERLGIPFRKEVKMEIPPLSQTFRSAGWVNGKKSQHEQDKEDVFQKIAELTINTITEEAAKPSSWIYPLAAGEEVGNWRLLNAPLRWLKVQCPHSSLMPNSDECKDASDKPGFNFERPICTDKLDDEDIEDQTLLSDLLRIVEPDEQQIVPHKELTELINLGIEEAPKEVKIGLDPEIAVHRLPTKADMRPVQQKLRKMKPDMLLKIKEELEISSMLGFFQKPNTLNGYNQIKMAPEDMEKTAFVTAWGVFYYRVMPFGLKNAGATYQRVMVALFHDMMHKEIEVYVDDMIAKARTPKEHKENLRKLFERLREVQLKLNPNKCTFGAISGKLLGFVVSKKGIEVDPDKIQAIQGLPPPQTQKEVKGFLGRLNYIGRLISQLTAKCDPIFKLLWKKNPGERNEECQADFEKIKEYLKAIKGSAIADFLADRATEEYEPVNFKFPDEDLMTISHVEEVEKTEKKWKVYFDGASNLSGQGIGAVLVSAKEDCYPATARLKFLATNNVAEYEACVLGIQLALERKVKRVEIYGDSALQVYLEHATEVDKRTLRRMVARYFLSGETLYKKGRDGTLMRCVESAEARKIFEEVHRGPYGSHASGQRMARQIMRTGYYWLTLEPECIGHVRKCHKCQEYDDYIHIPPNPLHVMTSPLPFSMWGIDVIGMITPKASNGHQFILVTIDYFTKWMEAASYPSVTQAVVARFIKREIICRYGLPKRIITDNASNLNRGLIEVTCKQFKIAHSNSTTYRPKMNGIVEAANKNIKKIIEKMTVTYRDWHEKLPFALHAYRVRTSTGATPYSLVYVMEAIVPIEVEIPSLRVYPELKLEEDEWVQERIDQLNLIDEKRVATICHGQLYQKRMERAYNKKCAPDSSKRGIWY